MSQASASGTMTWTIYVFVYVCVCVCVRVCEQKWLNKEWRLCRNIPWYRIPGLRSYTKLITKLYAD